MTLVPSLLQAIVRLHGEAVVMHVGDRPYVVTPEGRVDLATRSLTLDAVTTIVGQLLPTDSRADLDERGAAQCELPAMAEFPDEQFTVVATREGDDVWAEMRRRHVVAVPEGRAVTASAPVPPPASPVVPAAVTVAVVGESTATAPVPPAPPTMEPPVTASAPSPSVEPTVTSIARLLQMAAARHATTLYVTSGMRPSVRVDGDVVTLEDASVLEPDDVESLLGAFTPDTSTDVRSFVFRDHRGPGAVFHLMPSQVLSADALGIAREVRALLLDSDGLVIVTGPRGAGKRTLMAAFIDEIGRGRRDYVISIEREVRAEYRDGAALISRREAPDGASAMCVAAAAALREDPDVLVLEDVATPALLTLALDAAASGRFVIAGLLAHDTSDAVHRMVSAFPPDSRRAFQWSLARDLRLVVSQVLVKKKHGGGRLAARERLFNTPEVSRLLAEGRTSELPQAIEAGAAHGMNSLNEALVRYVQSGDVDVQEAYRRSPNRPGLVTLLRRLGLDVSAINNGNG